MSSGILYTFLALLTGLVISFKAIPIIIKDSTYKRLHDYPDGVRKLHSKSIPRLGGVAIFGGFMVSYAVWVGTYLPQYLPAVVASSIILFITGVKDDINGITPKKKIAGQFLAAVIVVFLGGIKIPGLDGLFGITSFPWYTGELFSVFAILVIINAYNLIDGIDGLAGMISIIGATLFGFWFLAGGHYAEALLSFSLVGAVAGFIWFNFVPAKIFMGDSGSQLIGFIIAISGFRLLQLNPNTPGIILGAPAVIIFSGMIIPLFDTLRVIILRLFEGVSPFKADRKHLHHSLLRIGLSPAKITLYLSLVSVFIVLVSLYIDSWNPNLSLVVVLMMAASILPVMKGIKTMSKIRFRIMIKPQIAKDSHILERSVSERKVRDRQIIAEEGPQIKVKLLNKENGYAHSRKNLH